MWTVQPPHVLVTRAKLEGGAIPQNFYSPDSVHGMWDIPMDVASSPRTGRAMGIVGRVGGITYAQAGRLLFGIKDDMFLLVNSSALPSPLLQVQSLLVARDHVFPHSPRPSFLGIDGFCGCHTLQ